MYKQTNVRCIKYNSNTGVYEAQRHSNADVGLNFGLFQPSYRRQQTRGSSEAAVPRISPAETRSRRPPQRHLQLGGDGIDGVPQDRQGVKTLGAVGRDAELQDGTHQSSAVIISLCKFGFS